jgi:Sec-independent protein translocase protein TatA
VRLAKGQEVSLGCGSLILIALIVLIFSGSGRGDLESEVRSLKSEIRDLKKAVDAQTGEIKALREKLEKAKGKE